jgi:hypothetical protein
MSTTFTHMATLAAFLACLCPLTFAQTPPPESPKAQTSKPKAPAKPHRLELRMFGVQGRPEPQPQPHDRFEIDRQAGEMRIQSADSEGHVRSYTIQLANQVKAQVATAVMPRGDGKYLYTYHLTNEAGARHSILVFAVGMADPDLVTQPDAPAHWRPDGASLAEWGTPARYNFSAFSLKDSTPRPLAAGMGAGPFSLVSPRLPGLTTAYLRSQEALSLPERLRASDWIHKRVDEETTGENGRARVLIVGPKLPVAASAEDGLAAIQKEMEAAAERPEFAEIRAGLLEYAASFGKPGQVRPPKPKTQLQRDFLAAMALNLAVYAGRKQ